MSPEQLCENLGGGARPFDPQPSKRNPSDEALRRVFSAARPPLNHFYLPCKRRPRPEGR